MNKIPIRASELDRVLTCNGSITLTRLVDPRQGDEGIEGTDVHAKTAYRLVKECGAVGPESLQGYAYKPSKGIADWIVNFCYEAVRDATPPDWSLECEMSVSYEFGRFILSGHPDVVAINPECTEFAVDDFKAGYIPVDIAENNWQLLCYAALLKRAYPTLQKGRLRIIQPRNNEDDGFPRISEATIENIDTAIAGLEARINAALDNQMEVNSGPVACRWCPAALQCPAVIQEREIMKVTLTPDLLSAVKREPNDATLADWMISAKVLSRPIDDATDLAKERIAKTGGIVAEDGTVITAKTENGAYKVPDPEKFMVALRTLLPDDSEIAKVVTFSQTRIKERIAEIMQIPKTGTRAAVTAESVHAAHLRPLVEQGTRTKLVFS